MHCRRARRPAASAGVLHEVAELMPRRGLVVLVSDLFFPTEEFSRASIICCFRGHDLIVFHVLDPLEHRLPVDGQVRFHDLETGEELTTQVDEIRAAYTARHRRLAGASSTPAAAAGRDRPRAR